MTAARLASIVTLALLGALAPGCALLSKSEPNVPRYFSAESDATDVVDASDGSRGLELRLGRVNADARVESRIERRTSAYEVVYYQGRLWTEKPEAYVRRALVRAIFDARGVRRVLSGAATVLDVQVVAFEEVVRPTHVGRVTLAYSLADDRVVLLSHSVTIERAIAQATGDAAADAIVEALAASMKEAVETVAVATVEELRAEKAARAEASSPPAE